MNAINRPFREFLSNVAAFLLLITIGSFFANSPFVSGIILSVMWALIAYLRGLDLSGTTYEDRAAKATVGFFFIATGIVLAGAGPIYLNTTGKSTDWLVVFGLFFGAQAGLSLLLTTPWRSLSFWFGYIVLSILLHGAIFTMPNEFSNLMGAKVLVLISLVISFWFLGMWLFFDNTELNGFEETKKAKQAKSIIGVFSGLLTVIEFFNIMYTIMTFR